MPGDRRTSLPPPAESLRPNERFFAPAPDFFTTVRGDPATEVVDLSINRGADLVAIGTHGRSGEVPLLLVRTPIPKDS